MTDFLILFVSNSLKLPNLIVFSSGIDLVLSSGIDLVLSSTLYKFIVWAAWARTQTYFGFNPISFLTIILYNKNITKLLNN